MNKQARLWLFLSTFSFLMVIVIIIYQADSDTLPSWLDAILNKPNADKVGHFVLMGMSAFLINLTLRDRSWNYKRVRIPWGPLIFAILVGMEEFSQQFFSNRTASWLDFWASLAGILVIGVWGSRLVLGVIQPDHKIPSKNH